MPHLLLPHPALVLIGLWGVRGVLGHITLVYPRESPHFIYVALDPSSMYIHAYHHKVLINVSIISTDIGRYENRNSYIRLCRFLRYFF
ncbi:MAG: hypothetical protein QXV72_03830 [Sulfolobales archaeon]